MTAIEVDDALVPAESSSEVAESPTDERRPATHGPLRALIRKPAGAAGVGIIVVLVLVAVFAPVLATHDPVDQQLIEANQPPAFAGGEGGHLLGTDNLGRDVFSRIVFGSRISLAVGLVAATVSAILGTALGLVAGWSRGIANTIIMRLADVQFAMPFLVICLVLVSVYGPGIEKVLVLLSVWGWAIYARTIMVSVAQVKELDYIAAARLSGAGGVRLLARHVLPNVWGPVVVLWSSAAGGLIMAESALSLLGLGVQAPQFSWGSMLAGGQTFLRTAWWMALFPGLALVVAVVGFNLMGDALRDVLNPKLANQDKPPELG